MAFTRIIPTRKMYIIIYIIHLLIYCIANFAFCTLYCKCYHLIKLFNYFGKTYSIEV